MSAQTINILIMIDTYNTIRTNAPVLYMVDDNIPADTSQGSSELTINCNVGDTLVWNAASIAPSWSVVLTSFVATGGTTVIAPYFNREQGWTGVVQSYGKETYHFTFTINGSSTVYQWDPFINVQPQSAQAVAAARRALMERGNAAKQAQR